MKRRAWIAAATGVLATVAAPVFAQGYPNKVVKLTVPFAPGGTTDIIARVISEPLGKNLGQSVIVENKAGGGGVVGALDTSRAAADGYTLGVATVSFSAGPAPRYGMWVTKVPDIVLNSSICRWPMPPVPEEEYEYLPGFFLSSARNSL